MSALGLLVIFKTAAFQIFEAAITLAPGPVAFAFYRSAIRDYAPLSQLTARQRYWRIAYQIFWGVLIAAVIAYGFGGSCSRDEDGACNDPDWVKPSSAHLMTSFVRLCILILGGMLFAYDKVKKERAGLL